MKMNIVIQEDKKLRVYLDETYDEILVLLKHRNSQLEQLSDDDELSNLHDLYALMKSGKIKISYDVNSGLRTLEIN